MKKNFPEIVSIAITLPSPYTAIFLSHYEQNSDCHLELVQQYRGCSSPCTLSVSAALTSRISLLDRGDTCACFVVKRQRIQGELVDCDDQKAALESLSQVSKTWISATQFKEGGAPIPLNLTMIFISSLEQIQIAQWIGISLLCTMHRNIMSNILKMCLMMTRKQSPSSYVVG